MTQHPHRLTREHSATLERREAAARPASFDAERLTCEAVVATASPIERRDERGQSYDEVLDVNGADLTALRGASVLDGHQQDGVASVIGTVEVCRIEGDQLIARLRFSSRPELAGVINDIRDGILSNYSIGYSVSEWATGEANGRRQRIARKWKPVEVSVVAVPADHRARTRQGETGRIAINREIRALGRQCQVTDATVNDLIDREATLEEARSACLEHMQTRSRLEVRVGQENTSPEAHAAVTRDVLYARMTGTTPSERARPFMHRSVIDLMAHHLRVSGVSLRSEAPQEVYHAAMQTRAAGLHTTSDFSVAMADTMNRRLGELFRAAESGASAIVTTGTARDFRPITEARMTSFPSLEPLSEAGEIKWGTMDEEGETLAIASYARAIGVTFQVIVNDDLGAIDRSIRDVAFATAQLKAKLVIAALAAKLADGKALFHADHKNLADTGAGIDETSLDEARVAMMRQTPPGSTEPLGIVPTILLVPPELQIAAEKMVAAINPASSENVNVFAGKLQVAVEARLADDAQWFLFASPGAYPAVRFLTLAGYEAPAFETSEEFTRLGTSYRVHWHVGAGPTDFRGAWMNSGASS
jgi:hypothetical protein